MPNKMIDPNAIVDAFEALGVPAFSYVYENKTKPSAYRVIHPLAKGGYGEVFLVERSGKTFAMKRIPKTVAIQNVNSLFYMHEKEIMTARKGDWLVYCHETLQDDSFLYYVMDFVPGGDLMTLITRVDRLSIREIRFYGAELVAAVAELHSHGWIHRDLKPDNILLDAAGHVKLGDFGTSIKLVDGKATSSFTVGTPDYVSRDLLVSVGESVTYGPEVDFWTVGVILFELFTGTPPFYSDSLKGTYSKISSIDYKIPPEMPADLKDLIENLICCKEKRIGLREIQSHPFFAGVDWENLKACKPPHVPRLKHLRDVSNFADLEFSPDTSRVSCGFKQFIGFTHDPQYTEHIIEAINRFKLATVQSLPEAEAKDTEDEEIAADHHAGGQPVVLCSKEDGKHIVMERMAAERDLQLTEEKVKREREEMHLIASQVRRGKDELEALLDKLRATKSELREMKRAVEDETLRLDTIRKCRLTNAAACNDNYRKVVSSELEDMKWKVVKTELGTSMEKIKKIAYWFYRENERLRNEVVALATAEDSDLEIKKELRIKKTEIREYQQKLEQEAGIRQRLEEEVASLKSRLQRERRIIGSYSFTVAEAVANRALQLNVKDGKLEIWDEDGSAKKICSITRVYVRDLKNNELHHLSYKKRALALKVFFLKEINRSGSSSSCTRRSLRALEEEYNRELKILKGLNDLLAILDGATRRDALLQKQGSIKKIEQLKDEIERAKKSTITEYEVGDDEKVYEFNNHLFYEKTVAKGTLCDHCNEVIYGVVNQAFCCKDCLMVVHKACYVLGDISCELNRAIKAGTHLSIICATLEDRDKIKKLVEFGSLT